MLNTLLLRYLSFLARAIIRRHTPYVIGVTGTVGKTTLTSYIASYLKLVCGEDTVGISPYHYNGEYGLPLTIIGARTGGKNPLLWIWIVLRAIWTYIHPYPRYLILEYGIDHPWEMEYLVSIVKPDIALLSPVAPNHLEQFGTLERYRAAKLLLIESSKWSRIVHESLRQYITSDHVLYYGQDEKSDAHILSTEQSIDSLHTIIASKGISYDIRLPSFGAYQAENILPLYLIANILDIDPLLIGKHTDLFVPEAGRSKILQWIQGASIIDGSYNGGRESICRGIDSLRPWARTHRIICLLGDMRELGDHAEATHRELAEYISTTLSGSGDVYLFLVGPLMRDYVYPMVKDIYTTESHLSSREAGREIQKLIEWDPKPTLIYVKWSQNTIFLEEAIKEILLNSEDGSLLCRQSEDWMKKKEECFQTVEKIS